MQSVVQELNTHIEKYDDLAADNKLVIYELSNIIKTGKELNPTSG